MSRTGGLFIADTSNNVIRAVSASPAPLLFAGTTLGALSAPTLVTVSNTGNAPLALLDFAGINAEPQFVEGGCARNEVLTAGQSCVLGVAFAPKTVGAVSGTVAITESTWNTLEPAYTIQTILLNGTGIAAASERKVSALVL
jgi:hypothetical protein